jgi:hypothetical protein
MSGNSKFDELLKGIGAGIADIREKVVEEPWFGRVVTEQPPSTPAAEHSAASPSFQDYAREAARNEPREARQQQEPAHEPEMER